MKLALGALGTKPSSLLWMAILIAAGVGCVHALSRLLAPVRGRSGSAAPLLGALGIVYCLQWDYRAVNANTLFLALVLFAFVALKQRREGAAGALLAASVALKLFSVPLLAVFALRGRWRAVGWTLAWTLGFFVVLPSFWYGPVAAWQLTGLWLDQLVGTASFDATSRMTAYNVSLWKAAHAFIDGGEGSVSASARTTAAVIGWAFAAGVAGWLWRGRSRPATSPDSSTSSTPSTRDAQAPSTHRSDDTLAIDLGLVLAATLLASPIAQPHQAVVLWPLAAVTARTALDGTETTVRRAGAAALLGVAGIGLLAAPSGVGKAIALSAAICLLSAGGWLASRAARIGP
jgi:hypothetical protein